MYLRHFNKCMQLQHWLLVVMVSISDSEVKAWSKKCSGRNVCQSVCTRVCVGGGGIR